MLTFRATGRGRIPMTEIDKCKPSGPKLYFNALSYILKKKKAICMCLDFCCIYK